MNKRESGVRERGKEREKKEEEGKRRKEGERERERGRERLVHKIICTQKSCNKIQV